MDKHSNLDSELINIENIYEAYHWVSKKKSNEELFLEQEKLYFEDNLIDNLKIIQECLSGMEYEFHRFDFIVKFKKIDSLAISYRPFVRFHFFDEIIIQCVINILRNEIRNFLPKENYGIRLGNKKSEEFYISWINQYKEFAQKQRENLAEDTVYMYTYEFDIQQFYPSIQQRKLLHSLSEILPLKENPIFAFWLEKIITYYNRENISRETIPIYEAYKESEMSQGRICLDDDLGLPQGPLFSPLLASFYTRDLFSTIGKEIKDNLKIDYDLFAYVDDGRIYFKSQVDKDVIENIVSKSLDSLNEDRFNDKKLKLNDKKSFLLQINEESITQRLNFLIEEISVVNASLNPKFEIDYDIELAALNKHEEFYQKIKTMRDSLLNDYVKIADPKKLSKITNELNKTIKEFTTYSKRKASFLTRKIAVSDYFYKYVDILFTPYNPEKASEDYSLQTDICHFNFYYNLYNLFNNAQNDEQKINYLCKKLKEFLASYKALLLNTPYMLFYYYSVLIKVIYSFDFYMDCSELIEDILSSDKDNKMLMKYYLSFSNSSWIQYYSSANKLEGYKTVINYKPYDSKNVDYESIFSEENAISYYVENPIQYWKTINLFQIQYKIEYTNNENLDNCNLVKKYDNCSLGKANKNYEIYVFKPSIEDKFLLPSERENYYRLSSTNLILSKKVWILLSLVKYWKNEIQFNEYIHPSYINYENIVVRVSPEKNIISILDNITSEYKQLKVYQYGVNYKELFLEFFKKVFNCKESILVNDKGKPLKFWEYRILAYLSFKNFSVKDFLDMLIDLLENHDFYNHDVDSNFERIKTIVDEKLGNSRDKDVILQLHYYLHCVWKNGSKDLPFFTLHNQEHSIELILNYLEMSKRMMGKLSLNKDELLILFEACYLHDIGMLKGLTHDEKYNIEDSRIVSYYSSLIEKHDEMFNQKIEITLNNAYQIEEETSRLYENVVRGEHHLRSSYEIQSDVILPLTDLEKKYVAIVSANHCRDGKEVYGLVSEGVFRKNNIDLRKISMWLRILDLTDITKYRVTQEVYDRYFDRMGIVPKFHWIKHLSIDSIEFKVTHMVWENPSITKLTIKVVHNYIPPQENLNRACVYSAKSDCRLFKKNVTKEWYEKISSKENSLCNLECAFLNENKWFDYEVEKINEYAKIYNEDFEMEVLYALSDEANRSDFKVVHDNGERKRRISATELIRQYFLEKFS